MRERGIKFKVFSWMNNYTCKINNCLKLVQTACIVLTLSPIKPLIYEVMRLLLLYRFNIYSIILYNIILLYPMI